MADLGGVDVAVGGAVLGGDFFVCGFRVDGGTETFIGTANIGTLVGRTTTGFFSFLLTFFPLLSTDPDIFL